LGHRRCADGSSFADGIDGQTNNKGYTGHEMPGQLDLVHMNGRIYDPLVARMMSADPFIQDPEHSQSYKRYTYVWNNPTNLTDPTWFLANDDMTESYGGAGGDSGGGGGKKDCDVRCQENRRHTDRCAAMAGNCSHVGTTGYEAQPSKSADNSGKGAPSATKEVGVVEQVTTAIGNGLTAANDFITSPAVVNGTAGFGDSLSFGLTGYYLTGAILAE
jgi:RHS repeat-associated protein